MPEKNYLRIEEPRPRLITKYNGKDLVFLHPAYGPNTYANVKEEIEKDGLATPTMAQIASLVHGAFNSDDKHSNEIKKIMKNKYLWAFTGTLYTPKGVYIQDNPEVRDEMPFMEESELVKKLEEEDPSVRFVPFGYKTKDMSVLELTKNLYVIALAGEEGAEKLAEIADKHKRKPYLWSFTSVNHPTTRVSSLYSGWDLDNHRLYFSGDDLGGNRGGHSFGV